MREASHEKGRRQLLGFMRFLCGLPASSTISEIANTYETSAAALVEATEPRGPVVHYDGVARIVSHSGPQITCYIESKFCGTPATVRKLKGHVHDFVADAYCVLEAWPDDPGEHSPNFLFVANAFGDLQIVDEFGRLRDEYVRSALTERGIDNPGPALSLLLATFTFVHYSDWLQGVMA